MRNPLLIPLITTVLRDGIAETKRMAT